MTLNECAAFLRARDKYLILTHRRPDGDTVGCAAGLCLGLRRLGKTAYVLPNPEATEKHLEMLTPCVPPADYTPELIFERDRSIENGARLTKLIDDVMAGETRSEERAEEDDDAE